jgi:hypothetical protein
MIDERTVPSDAEFWTRARRCYHLSDRKGEVWQYRLIALLPEPSKDDLVQREVGTGSQRKTEGSPIRQGGRYADPCRYNDDRSCTTHCTSYPRAQSGRRAGAPAVTASIGRTARSWLAANAVEKPGATWSIDTRTRIAKSAPITELSVNYLTFGEQKIWYF